MENFELKLRDSISNYLLSEESDSLGETEVFDWLNSTSSQIGDFDNSIHSALVEKALSLESSFFKLSLIDFLMLDIEIVSIELIDVYFKTVKSVRPEKLDHQRVAHSLSLIIEKTDIDKEIVLEKVRLLSSDFAVTVLSTLETNYAISIESISSDMRDLIESNKRLTYRVQLFWHFLSITKPILIKLLPIQDGYSSSIEAINDWAYSENESAQWLVEEHILSVNEKLIFEEFGRKLRLFLENNEGDKLEESSEFQSLCDSFYQRLFDKKDIFGIILMSGI